LKHETAKGSFFDKGVRARVPEKQGLKLVISPSAAMRMNGPGASSRKTRIETTFLRHFSSSRLEVRARVPEKQGLKLRPRYRRIDPPLMSGREFQKNKD